MNNFYTYELCSSATPTIPFYIGKGKGNRMYFHEKNAIEKPNKHLYVLDKIRSILKEGNTIVYRKIIENVSEKEVFRWEVGRIVVLKVMGFKLCNLTNGGEGTVHFGCPLGMLGKHHTNETKKKQSKAAKNRLPVSDETRRKISEGGKGKHSKPLGPCSEETKKKISESLKNYIFTKEHKENVSKAIKIWWNKRKGYII
jgi:hypothetical protein